MKTKNLNLKNNKRQFPEIIKWVILLLLVGYILFRVSSYNSIRADVIVEKVEIPTSIELSQIEPVKLDSKGYEGMSDSEYFEIMGVDRCNLSFWSNKTKNEVKGFEFKQEDVPLWFKGRIANYSCTARKWLTRLAHYESEFNPEAVNGNFKGLYQIGKTATNLDSTFGWCTENGHGASDEDCAIWLVNRWLEQSPLIFESYANNKNSFTDLTF